MSRSVVLRRAAALLLVTACAQIEMPPGGPEDRMPPYVVEREPDSMAVVPGYRQPVVIRFNERISEQGVEQSVMVSPRTSAVTVDRGSREVRVSLRGGWEADRIYHVTLRPEIQDLFNNRITEPVRLVFSTGPAIPDTRLTGLVRDRITGEPEADARVEAIRTADSLVYAVPSDSAGRFVFAQVPEGEYLIRGYPDRNINRALDAFEARDSAAVSIAATDTAEVELSIVMPDSTAPVIASVEAPTPGRVEVRFDDHLDPAQAIDTAAVTIAAADGTVVAIAAVTVGEPPVEAPDTVGAEPPLPSQLVVVQLAEGVELTPEAQYTVAMRGILNVVGLPGDSQEEFTAPEPPPPPEEPEETPDALPDDGDAPDSGAPADPVPQG